MAFRAFLIAIFVVVAIAPALATDYMVGDNAGWNLGVNYTAWAEGKDFRVGDKLMFMYNSSSHNVLKVNGTDFKACTNSNASQAPLTSGNDVIPLAAPGKKWYICSIGDHCSRGMKLVITVSEAEGPAPSPTPGTPGTSSGPAPSPKPGTPGTSARPAPPPTPGTPGSSAAVEVSPLKSCVWMVAVVAVYRMIMA